MKTRAFDPETKQWRTDYVVMPDGTLRQLTYNKNYAAVLGGSVNWKLSRFTGLCDKNGKEIYEGDICRIVGFHVIMQDRYPTGPVPIETPFDRVMVVKMDNPYCPTFDVGEGDSCIEVLGNVYETPKLIEVVQ